MLSSACQLITILYEEAALHCSAPNLIVQTGSHNSCHPFWGLKTRDKLNRYLHWRSLAVQYIF